MKQKNNSYSKESIKNRMLRNISILWDVQGADNIDPIVKLLIESLSSEIFKLFGEFTDMEDRILSRLSMAMTPTTELVAKPAHAIVQLPVEESDVVISKDNTTLYFNDLNFLRQNSIKRIGFTPIVSTKLINATVTTFIIENSIYNVSPNLKKYPVAYAQKNEEHLNFTTWIGIDVADKVVNIENLSLYFDIANIDNKAEYLRLLPYTKWSLNEKELYIKEGCDNMESTSINESPYTSVLSDKICCDISAKYKKHYLTIKTPINSVKNEKKLFPEELIELYDPDVIESYKKPLIWLKVKFPPHFNSSMIKYLLVDINIIPIVNLSLSSQKMTVNNTSVIIPLPVGKSEYYINVEDVSDSSNKKYVEFEHKGFTEKSGDDLGTYSIRKGGCERFETNDAKNYLIRLIDLLRDESGAFSSIKSDDLQDRADDLMKCIEQLEISSDVDNANTDTSVYLMADNATHNEALSIRYWVSNGTITNNIKAGSNITIKTSAAYLPNTVPLITTFKDGELPPDTSKINNIYRYWLTSQNSIFSRMDIINFCKAYYSKQVKTIRVESGAVISHRPNEGVVNAINIYIELYNGLSRIAIEDFKENLIDVLESRSPVHYNYKLFIEN